MPKSSKRSTLRRLSSRTSISVSVPVRPDGRRPNSSAPASRDKDDKYDEEYHPKISGITSSRTSSDRPISRATSVRRHSPVEKTSKASGPRLSNASRSESFMGHTTADLILNGARATSSPTSDVTLESINDADPQLAAKSSSRRKRDSMKSAIRTLLRRGSKSECYPNISAHSANQESSTKKSEQPQTARSAPSPISRPTSSSSLRNVRRREGRQKLESYSPLDSIETSTSSLPRRVPSTSKLRSPPLASVKEAPNEGSTRHASFPRRSASGQFHPGFRNSQLGLGTSSDYKLKRKSRSLDALFDVAEGDVRSIRRRRSGNTESWRRGFNDTEQLGSSEAVKGTTAPHKSDKNWAKCFGRHATAEPTASGYLAERVQLPRRTMSSIEARGTHFQEPLRGFEHSLEPVTNDVCEVFAGERPSRMTDDQAVALTDERRHPSSNRTSQVDRPRSTSTNVRPARSLSSFQHSVSPTIDQFITLLNLVNHERAARKALDSHVQELKIELAELRSKTASIHPLRMNPLPPLPQAPPSPPPRSPDVRLSGSFSALIKHRLEKATRFTPPPSSSPDSADAAHMRPESDRISHFSNSDSDYGDASGLDDAQYPGHAESSQQTQNRGEVPAPRGPPALIAESFSHPTAIERPKPTMTHNDDGLEYLPATTYVPNPSHHAP